MNYNDFYQKSLDNPELFWKEQAEQIEWYTKIEIFTFIQISVLLPYV